MEELAITPIERSGVSHQARVENPSAETTYKLIDHKRCNNTKKTYQTLIENK